MIGTASTSIPNYITFLVVEHCLSIKKPRIGLHKEYDTIYVVTKSLLSKKRLIVVIKNSTYIMQNLSTLLNIVKKN